MWAYRKARRLAAFGLAPSANTVAGAHNGSLEEQLSAIQEQYNHYDQLIVERSRKLKELVKQWKGMRPPLDAFPGEKEYVLDTEPYDLSLTRLEEATSTVDTLLNFRRTQQDKLVTELDRIWERVNEDQEVREKRRSSVKGLSNEDFHIILDELAKQRKELEKPMIEVQARLKKVWGTLGVPDHVTAAYGWAHGQPLTESLLVKCEEEASTLEECAARLQPLLAEQNRKDLGMAIALLHGSLKRAEEERRRTMRRACEAWPRRLRPSARMRTRRSRSSVIRRSVSLLRIKR